MYLFSLIESTRFLSEGFILSFILSFIVSQTFGSHVRRNPKNGSHHCFDNLINVGGKT